MEVVGAAVGVADVAGRVSHRVYKLCEAWKDAPRDVFQLRDDLARAQDFYGSLKEDVAKSITVILAPPPTKARDTETGEIFYSAKIGMKEANMYGVTRESPRVVSGADNAIAQQYT